MYIPSFFKQGGAADYSKLIGWLGAITGEKIEGLSVSQRLKEPLKGTALRNSLNEQPQRTALRNSLKEQP